MLKRLLRRAVHTVAYYAVIKPSRKRTVTTRAARFPLVVRPTVFHPKWFLSSEILADFIGRFDLAGKTVVDVGTGSGVLALAAARAGARLVVAVDVNPEAARATSENALVNGFGDRVAVVCGDLLSAISPDARFDVVLSNPPFFPGEPRDLADRAWHAGPAYRDIAPMFEQIRERLAPDGRAYMVLSSEADLPALHDLMERAGLQHRIADFRILYFESMLIYEMVGSSQ